MQAYKPQKKKKDPNAPKQPLSAYFIFSSEERNKVKEQHPNFSICEVAKELGRRWADMAPEVKQKYQQMAEEGRQKYDQDMAAYRQGNYQVRISTNRVARFISSKSERYLLLQSWTHCFASLQFRSIERIDQLFLLLFFRQAGAGGAAPATAGAGAAAATAPGVGGAAAAAAATR